MKLSDTIRGRLNQSTALTFSSYAIIAAFGTYFSMYAFRKPFAAGTYEAFEKIALPWGGFIAYKTLLIITQVLGYCLSKFIGIKVISELPPASRALGIVTCIAIAWGALLLFPVVPAPYNIVCLFVNGLPLGMVWGLTFGFLEGRRFSEVLGVGLSASYIVASGAVKGVGTWLITQGVPELWMPFATGAIFVIPMGIFVYLLACLPPPSEEDIALRSERAPMDGPARLAFFKQYWIGLTALTTLYITLTAYRDFRDNFSVEIWKALGYRKDEVSALLANTELVVTIGVLVLLALLMVIRDNRRALLAVHVIMLSGTALVGLSTLLFELKLIDAVSWMSLVGLGLYAAYVPFGCILFDRLIATVGAVGTAGFLIYLTDAFGYLGAVNLMLYRDLGQPDLSWLTFFTKVSYLTSIICTALYLVSLSYFAYTTRQAGTKPERSVE